MRVGLILDLDGSSTYISTSPTLPDEEPLCELKA